MAISSKGAQIHTAAAASTDEPPAFEEKNDLNRILRWPKPARIIRRLQNEYPQSNAIPFIQFLDDWLYRELSTQSHLEPRGLGELGLLDLPGSPQRTLRGTARGAYVRAPYFCHAMVT